MSVAIVVEVRSASASFIAFVTNIQERGLVAANSVIQYSVFVAQRSLQS